MLAAIRSLARSPIAVLIIIVPLLAAFALFGVTDVFRVAGTSAVEVGSQSVSARELASTYSRQLQQIQIQNPGFTREQAEEVGLPDQVLNQLTVDAAIAAKADDLGLGISDAAVREQIRSIEAFRNPFTGRFDRQTYAQALSQANYTEAEFERSVRTDLIRAQLVAPLVSGIDTPATLASARRAFTNERRTINALLISPSMAGDIPDPDDAQLQAFIEENAQFFQRPEFRRITLVRVDPDAAMRDIDIAEEDLRELYEIRLEQGELADPATRTLRYWNASDAAAAQDAAERISGGQAPGDVATDLGLGEPVTLEAVQAYEIPDAEVADAAFDLGEGEAAAIESRLGWRVLYIDGAIDPDVPGFQEARSGLLTELASDQAEQVVLDRIYAFDEQRTGGATIAEAATSAGIPVERFDFVNEDGISEAGYQVQGLAGYPEILSSAFELPEGFDSDPAQYGDGGYFVLRVDEVDPSRLPALADVREQAETTWRFRQVDDRLGEIVEEAMARVDAGDSLNVVADDLGAGARVETATLLRSETAGPFNQQLVQQAFAAPQGQPFQARAGDQRTRAVAVVEDIVAPAPGPLPANAVSELSAELEADLSQALQSALLARYEVRRNPDIIDQALGRTSPQ